ncbi:component of SufBCD complex [Palleronia sp.]|uniref:component of SufBCD complex n=1 Tax=Palleronia sp. TaxID=1940284 RepID=UPI0035C87D20
MDWYATVFELIDMRSFSNLWYWIALATVWSTASHYVLGVPYDMVGRAARQGGQSEQDLEDVVRIRVARILYIAEVSGLVLVALGATVLTTLLLLGFVYGVEFAQAVFLIAAPMSLVGALGIRCARDIAERDLSGDDLRDRLRRHRAVVQGIGMISIFVTALWGMYQNFGAALPGY